MAFIFKAIIYKVGINPAVDVPVRITEKLIAAKGYIPVRGTINKHAFYQTLCPVKNSPHRLYVNGPMMKGAVVQIGDEARFKIEQDDIRPHHAMTMPVELEKRLKKEKLLSVFEQQTPSRKKEVFRYLTSLKTEESLLRNIDKLIANLKRDGTGTPWVPKKRP